MALSRSSLKVGDSRSEVLVDDLSRTQLVMYAGASGDYNPVHTDHRFATEVAGYDGVFAHGMLTMGLTGRVLTDWVGDGRLTKYGVRFKRQVFPGDTLTATATVESIDDAIDESTGELTGELTGGPLATFSIVTVNQEGDEVLSGTATARLDP